MLEYVITALLIGWLAITCVLILQVVVKMRPFDHRRLSNQLTVIVAVPLALILVGRDLQNPPDSWDSPLRLILGFLFSLVILTGALGIFHLAYRLPLRMLSEFFARRTHLGAEQQRDANTPDTTEQESSR